MKQASKSLINTLSFVGLCWSYDEAQLFEASISKDPEQRERQYAYVQFVLENTDHDTNTINRENNVHAMAEIMCVALGCKAKTCSCEKHDLPCTDLCTKCHGKTRENVDARIEIASDKMPPIMLEDDIECKREILGECKIVEDECMIGNVMDIPVKKMRFQ